MNSVLEILETINNLLLQKARGIGNIGLSNGKMGISFYFFHLARETGNNEYQVFAETLIEEIYGDVDAGIFIPGFENGLAGIAWGLEGLVQNGFVESETDQIFTKIDNRIYRYLVNNPKLSAGVTQGAMGYILYILARLERKDIHNESARNYIFKRLLIELVNRIGECVEDRTFVLEEPLLFDITWDLPVCLTLLAKVRKLEFYETKIDRILEHLSPLVLSLYPRLLSHQLYLLLGMESVNLQVQLPNWGKHIEHLKHKFQLSELLNKEFKDQHLYWLDGITGVSLLTRLYNELIQDEGFSLKRKDLLTKIRNSTYWEDLKQDELKQRNLGLLYGIAGIGMELLELLKDHQEKQA